MTYEILPFGESAILVNFEQRIAPEINDQVVRLNKVVRNEVAGVQYTIPAYASLTIGFNSTVTSREALNSTLHDIVSRLPREEESISVQQLRLPVCYAPSFAPDKDRVERISGLTWHNIISIHSNRSYRVYMLGFIAGFAYMGTLPIPIQCPRLPNPRARVEAGSVGIAAGQTGIYPVDAPGGWNLIGRCPIPLLHLPDSESPFLFKTGQAVTFDPISITQFEEIANAVASGKFNYDDLID